MLFNQIIGQDFLVQYFKKTIATKRVPNTQLFTGNRGVGTLPVAWAFASEILCGEKENCRNKVKKIIHPDLHFIFPTISQGTNPKAGSDIFLPQWREFLTKYPYGDFQQWLNFIEAGNKQASIRVSDAESIIKKVNLKPYEANCKVFIIWMAEKMNPETNNKLLKVLEEPPEDTKFILVAENLENILSTVLSRCQIHKFKPIPFETISKKLMEEGFDKKKSLKIAHQSQGNWFKANQLKQSIQSDTVYQELFVNWVRTAFLAKKNKTAIQKLIEWSEKVASMGREEQKYLLNFITESFRQALLINYGNDNLYYLNFEVENFDLKKFAPFINENNIEEIVNFLDKSKAYIERNANSRLVFLNLSLLLTKLIHRKKI